MKHSIILFSVVLFISGPKEFYNLYGPSGGVAVFEPMVKDVMVPYMISLREFPNKDYSKVTRGK